MPSILAIIPARGGSKSIPKKNITTLNNLPLIAYTLNALHKTKHKVNHLVSTDDPEVRQIALKYGGHVPALRPPSLAMDKTNIIEVILHILADMKKTFDYILLLQPTAPLRTSFDIDNAIDLILTKGVASVCSFMTVDSFHPWYMYYYTGKDTLEPVAVVPPGTPRQFFPKALWRNGAIYLVKTNVFLKERKFITTDCIPYMMPPERSVNIDSLHDIALAEFYLKQNAYSHHRIN